MSRAYSVVIVGSGHGGAQAAIALRQRGYAGSIAIVGEEVELPYERPPLSKEYLAGDKSFERLLIRPASFWANRQVEMLTRRRVVAVNPAGRTVTTATGEMISYEKLIWAAGGHARRLTCAGHDLNGVHSVRSRADVDRMLVELTKVRHICVVGGGYIGLEAAAVLTKLGKSVTLLEAQGRVLARVAGLVLSRFYETEHRAHGVDLRLGVSVESILGAQGRAIGVRLADNTEIACDMVVVGIGIIPEVQPLCDVGAECGNGVKVDASCRTTLQDVFAIGDCAVHRNTYADGDAIRLECVQNAHDMAMTVAKAIVGEIADHAAIPWFWSNQFDLRLQTVGLSTHHDHEIVRGDPASRSFSVVYLRGGRVIALDCVNAVRDFVQGKALILRTADPLLLADPSMQLKEIASV